MGAGEAVSASRRMRRLGLWSSTCKNVPEAVSIYDSLGLHPSCPLSEQKKECMLFRNASCSALQPWKQWQGNGRPGSLAASGSSAVTLRQLAAVTGPLQTYRWT